MDAGHELDADARDRDVVDVHPFVADERQQEIERPRVLGEFDQEASGRRVEGCRHRMRIDGLDHRMKPASRMIWIDSGKNAPAVPRTERPRKKFTGPR